MNRELEFAAGNYADDTFGFSNESRFYWKDCQRHFIAGATSKWVEKQKLEFAISLLLQLRASPISEIDNKVEEFEQKLSKI